MIVINEGVSYAWWSSPVGKVMMSATGGRLTGVHFVDAIERCARPLNDADEELLARTQKQLWEYFDGERKDFDLPLSPRGTEFQLRVWNALRMIPYGCTLSYEELARHCGNTKAARAVGMANNKNPISIVVPCHRVIGADGSLKGYSGGVDKKRSLLDLEAGFVHRIKRS
ncbi:methylated-DNA-[protein]-cysteine S-methyltransferase [Ferrithrix thermotolerans DSM 19514]|uniref:Methylated-DNA--protein-cysteine methyltransferase n=1 Tax=Ferrithrix thermotolerans DSM 19514 TaxID=1121881 RepID=A0A1M4WY11_9ACTN|nr:methylated-DNA--[protein]-cysteine S-methyltransferase [Ferrithrix thermotolerans]SHE86134.1 methylated-DNA-[protein]-cysteine S-methyltransferase [Ferrithrix thermotolerans DSM 19514]